MAVEIRVPHFGESVTEAVVGRWLKKEGEPVAIDEAVVELETDKVAVEVTAEQGGVLQHIAQAEGATVNVGDVLATLAEGVGAAAATSDGATASSAQPTPASAEAPRGGNGVTASASARSAESPTDDAHVTPVARRYAAERGVELAQVGGTGPGGRITKDDVDVYLNHAAAPPVAPITPQGAPSVSLPVDAVPVAGSNAGQASVELAALLGTGPREERARMSRRRQTIARRLVEAQHTAAMLTTFNEVDMSAIMEVRKRRRDAFKERYGVGLGFMSFFTKAVVGALKAFPRLNAEIQGDELVLKRHYDIGVAVGADEGLVVPVLRDADRKSFAEIEREIGELAKRARDNKLTLAELTGGTFTITNGGTFGSLLSTPILNTPEVGILGMHKIEERPIAVKGEVVIRPMMYLALSYDHRIVDGREAVQFLVRVKELVEDPETLMLEG
jgi:2-oxoglutarate dehydrogenase E2 component (dihydrolipoamide succinyltransferase)